MIVADWRPIDPLESGLPFMVAAILLRKRRGKCEALMVEAIKKYGVEAGTRMWKFPGGMQEFADSSNPLRTLDSELHEETGFYLRPNLSVDPPVLQRERSKVDSPRPHFRYFYLLWR